MHSSTYLAAVAALIAPTFAQTFTSCNPTEKDCPADPALGKSIAYDFTQGAPSDFSAAAGPSQPTFGKNGATFSIAKDGDSPTFTSDWYIMFGHYKVVMKAAPGQGIVSSLVLQSDDLDEIDWEWVGSQTGKVQTNYYGKGNTTVYDRGLTVNDGTSSDGYNTYELDWTSDHVQWIINGNAVRTLTPATADYNQYPQTPMQFKIGSWAAGDSSSEGTSEWAGGKVNWSQGPFDMIVKSVQITDYSSGKSYSYGDKSGSWESIESNGGKISGSGSVPGNVSTASASPSATALSTTSAKPVTGTAIPTTVTNSKVSQQTGAGTASVVATGANAGATGSSSSGSSGSAQTSGSGSSQSTGTTSSGTTSSSSPASTGAAASLKPVAGVVAAGLLALLVIV